MILRHVFLARPCFWIVLVFTAANPGQGSGETLMMPNHTMEPPRQHQKQVSEVARTYLNTVIGSKTFGAETKKNAGVCFACPSDAWQTLAHSEKDQQG